MKLNKRWLLSVRACGQDRTKIFDHEPTEQDVDNFYTQINRSCRVSQFKCEIVYIPESGISEASSCKVVPKMSPTIRKF